MNPTGTDRRLLEMFMEEVKERSSDIENALLSLEAADDRAKRTLQAELLRMAHSLKGAAGLVQIRQVEALCHRMEGLLSLARQEGRVLSPEETDLLLSATDSVRDAGHLLSRGQTVPSEHGSDILRAMARREPQPGRPRGGRLPVRLAASRASDLDGSLRVSGARLDALLHRSGELLVSDNLMRSRADEAASLRELARDFRFAMPEGAAGLEAGLRELSASLAEDGRRLHASVSTLEAEVRKARMQPFAEACMGLPRIARDVADAFGKSAALEVRGGDVEIDRSVLSGLHDALRHLVRNAVAHGIESPDERRTAGKPETGTVTVSASLSGDRFQVRVEDDGRGFDHEALREAARKAGLPEVEGEKQLLRLAFQPGVSTSRAVTEQSGRGVGLEIVRAAAEGMRGSVVASRAPGGGTIFTLTLPLTLATVRALQIVTGGVPFVIDLASVQRIARIPAGASAPPDKSLAIPVLDLGAWLGLPGPRARESHVPAVVVGPPGSETAILVEEVCGEIELLARSLGPRLEKIRHYSGATVLPDGRIALLLNASALAEAAEDQSREAVEPSPPAAVSAKRKVLVVDDSPSIRTLLKLVLEASGYDVSMAQNGSEALTKLRAHGADAVVADVDMPSMDGFSLTEAIRQSEDLRNLPVILVTGRETLEDKERGMAAGANAYVTKAGFDRERFLEIVRQVA